ncbi:MAG: fibrobacter succinogenes major paralogous domain-containing protein [Fibrobacter sp.]|uniref:fibrobacter succinogenes major paralogous domain-containing protein n=1 Tax=Fibrobacter sp. TaxID=35828 RepID=UPI0025C6D444|nr:fibrobacter succinogenes major paralogous domain-containing protein [Fibrobacter sp.]MBR4784719.1 fibrobacter succinogenes major paralogous domain-containing protein [Fibrobacter sp.]
MKRLLIIVLLLALSFAINACDSNSEIGSMTDSRDGQTYKTVKIGNQVWMAENLNFKTDSSWCYKDEESNCQKYGRLYSWNAARGACPAGWHLPSKVEFDTLFKAVGGTQDKENEKKWRGAGSKLKSTSGWESSAKGLAFGLAFAMPAYIKSKEGLKDLSDLSISSNGTDDYSFTALPAGIKEVDYNYEGFYAEFWSSTEVNSEFINNAEAYILHLVCLTKTAVLNGTFKEFGLSVRCVKDSD